MNFKRFNNQYWLRLNFCFFVFVLLISGFTYGQDCPSFKIKEIIDTNSDLQNGSVIVDIISSKQYSTDNFRVRQKQNQFMGPIGYELDISVSGRELIIKGLKKSEELELKEYVILFSDRGCKNSQVIEVDTFSIK